MAVQPVRILLTSDVHSKVDNIYRIGMWLQQRHIRLDFTLLCGDLVNANHDYDDFASSIPSFSASSSSRQKISPSLQQAADLMANARRRQEESEFQYVLESFKGFTPRVFYVPGNHDPSEAFPDLHPAPTISTKDSKNEERVAAAPLWQRMDVRTGAKNIHGRLARLGTGLILGGFGGSVPQTMHGTGKPVSVHPGYPYDEAAIGTGVSNVLKDKRHLLAIPDVLTSKTRSITGPVTDTHILMTHCGPASLGTTDVNKTPHIPGSRLETGSRALSTLLSLPYFQGAVPDAAAYAQLWKEAKTPKKNALSGGLMFHVHGHSHAAWGISHLGSVPVINPGALRDGRFVIATIEWSLNEGLVATHRTDTAVVPIHRLPALGKNASKTFGQLGKVAPQVHFVPNDAVFALFGSLPIGEGHRTQVHVPTNKKLGSRLSMALDEQDGEAKQELSMSVDQTNALRISLGLKPLTEGKSTEKEQTAEDNFAKHKAELAKKAQRRDLIQEIAREKAKASRNVKLQGATLGAASDDEDATGDSLAWVQRQREKDEKKKLKAGKKKAASQARKKEVELAAMDEDATSSYRSSDLQGLRVDHDLEDVVAGGEAILTLKDSTIEELEEEGDVLQNVQLVGTEKLRKNLDNIAKKGAYNVYDEDEFGKKRNILSQYDEEIDGVQKSGFVINADGAVDVEKRKKEVSEQMRENVHTLAYDKTLEIKDYYTQEEMVSFKKPKKKKKSRKERQVADDVGMEVDNGEEAQPFHRDSGSRRGRQRREPEEDDQDGDRMDVDEPAGNQLQTRAVDYSQSNRNANIDNVNFVDDDDLQSALARARRVQMKKQVKVDIEDMAKAALRIQDDQTLPEGTVTLSATSEFVRTLATAPTPKASEPPRSNRPALPKDDSQPGAADQIETDERTGENGGWDARETEEEMPDAKPDNDDDERSNDGEILPAPIEEEPLVGAGLAATLALLTQKGFVEKADPLEVERLKNQNEKRAWLAEQKKLDRIREIAKQKEKERNREKNKASGGKHNNNQNQKTDEDYYREEQEARYAERERARETEERFKRYIPDVKLEYHDEYGRKLNQKEAYRQLSHKFHGKSSGKMKTERRLRKIEDELKMEKMGSNDTPLGTGSALVERTRIAGAAHVVLSVGNRAALPPDISLTSLRSSSSSKPKSGSKSTVPATITHTVVDPVAFGVAAPVSSSSSADVSHTATTPPPRSSGFVELPMAPVSSAARSSPGKRKGDGVLDDLAEGAPAEKRVRR